MVEEDRKFEIIVNGKPKPCREDTISYSQVVDLAFPQPHKPTEVFTVQYSQGPKENCEGTLVGGQASRDPTFPWKASDRRIIEMSAGSDNCEERRVNVH